VDPEREWWLRVPAVFLSPRSVFVALRNESREDIEARSEPVLALVSLAGIAVALGTSTARALYDNLEYDPLLVAVWAVIAGGIVAFAGYFIVGGAVYLGARGLGSEGSFLRARHVLGFAVAPLALSLLLLWPIASAASALTTETPARSSRRSSSASPPGRPRCCSSACAPYTAGAGGARSPRSVSSRSS
jgi:hypothetical protein